MEETIKIELTKSEVEQVEAMLDVMLREIDASLERMDKYDAERLKTQAETKALRAQIEVMLECGKKSLI